MLQNKKQNHNDCQSLREWHCQPDSRHTQELRQQNKTRNKENKATQQSKNRSWLYSFNTLKITYHSNIHNEKDKAACKIGETVYRYICCNQVGFIWLSTDWIKLARERAMDKKKPDCSEPPYFSCFQITLYLTCKDNTFFLKKQQNKSQSVWIHNHESWLNL